MNYTCYHLIINVGLPTASCMGPKEGISVPFIVSDRNIGLHCS
jgi:hypothetical protein